MLEIYSLTNFDKMDKLTTVANLKLKANVVSSAKPPKPKPKPKSKPKPKIKQPTSKSKIK